MPGKSCCVWDLKTRKGKKVLVNITKEYVVNYQM